MLSKFFTIHQSQRGMAILTLAMAVGITAILGVAVTVATIQVWRGGEFSQASLLNTRGQFTATGQNISAAQSQITQHPIYVSFLRLIDHPFSS